MTARRQDGGWPALSGNLPLFLVITLAALLLRLVHLWFFSQGTPFFDPQPWNTRENPLDTGEYDRWARQIIGGDHWWTDHGQGEYFQSPVYPYFVAGLYLIAGRSIMAVAVVQALLSALTCGMTAWLARRLVSPAAGWLAGSLAVLFAPSIFYGSFLLKETLATFLLTIALLLTVGWWQTPGEGGNLPRRMLGIGFAWGATVAAWPLLAPLALLTFGGLILQGRWPEPAAAEAEVQRPQGSMSRALTIMALLAAGSLLAVLPCTVRNAVGEGRFVLISDAGPRNWEVGNARNSTGTYIDFPRHVVPVQKALFSPVFWRQYGTRLSLFIGARDIPQVTDSELLRAASPVLSLPLPGFGLLLPFALAGLLLVLRKHGRQHLHSPWVPVVVVGVGYPLLLSLFFIVGRFRLPVAPALMVMASLAALTLRGWHGGRDRAMRVTALSTLVIILLAAGFVNRQQPLPRGAYPFHHTWADYHLRLGDGAARDGRLDEARSAWQEVLKLPSSRSRQEAERRLQQTQVQ